MFRKCISYLVIYSLLWSNCAWAMKGEVSSSDSDSEGGSSPRHRPIQIKESEPQEEAQDRIPPESILPEKQPHGFPLDQESVSELDTPKSLASSSPSSYPGDEVSASSRSTREKDGLREDSHLTGTSANEGSDESGSPSKPAQSTSQVDVVIEEGSLSSSRGSLSEPDVEMSLAASEEHDVNKEKDIPAENPQDKAELKEEHSHIDRTSTNEDSLESCPPSNPTENAEIKEDAVLASQEDQDQGHDQRQLPPSSESSSIQSSEGSSHEEAKEDISEDQSTSKVDVDIEEGSSSSSDESLSGDDFEMDFIMVDPEVKIESRSRDFSYDFEDQPISVSTPLLRGKLKGKRFHTLAKKYLQQEGINSQNLTPEQLKALGEILAIEGSWKNPLIWANLQAHISRLVFALSNNKNAVSKKEIEACCSPLWLHGGPIPLENTFHINKNILLKTFGNALEDGTIEFLHALLTGLLGYQIYQAVSSQSFAVNFKFIVDFYEDADSTSYLGMIQALHANPIFFSVLAAPPVFALLKTLWTALKISQPTDEDVQEVIEKLKNTSLKWDGKIVNGLYIVPVLSLIVEIPFFSDLFWHPINNNIPTLTHLILWDGRLSSGAREKAFDAILGLAYSRSGLSQMAAIRSLFHIAHGLHTSNLHLRPHDKEELLKIKVRAFEALQELYQKLPYSLNKVLTGVLLWEMGQSPHWLISLGEPFIKVLRAVLYLNTFYGLGQVLYKYFNCRGEYLNNFTWVGGVEPYASDYSQACFDAQVQVFNTLPGQPAYTLVSNLSQYHFPNNTYNLDLSNKGIEGPVIAEIVEGFQNARISLSSLNITGNLVTNSSDIARILIALPPEITNLNMSNINPGNSPYSQPNDFFGLGQLTGLQSLDLSNSLILENTDAQAVGKALQNLPDLQEFRVAENSFGDITQIAEAIKPSFLVLDLTQTYPNNTELIDFGRALTQNPNFQRLYLEGTIGLSTEYPMFQSEVNIALAQGLSVQHSLNTLDLSSNRLGANLGYNLTTLLESFPSSLTYLDIFANHIGQYDVSEVDALARAIGNMSGLTTFIAGAGNTLGSSPMFLGTLQGKENLTFLDLSDNNFNNTEKVAELLQTTSHIQFLDLSYNQLINGSILGPVLSSLSDLQALRLGNNSFTTVDRIEIFNATSTLAFPPFPLNEDLTFTKYYLESLSPTIQSLNFSGLITSNPDSLQIIMPQVRELFPNLMTLDLSNNNLIEEPEETEGIQALINCLPQFTNINSLRISASGLNADPLLLRNFSQTIGQLQYLQFLDLSNTESFYAESLGIGIANTRSLTSVNLAACWREGSLEDTWQGGIPLFEGLKGHSNLTNLDLSYNPIGALFRYNAHTQIQPDPSSTIALADALQSWPQLRSLNLAGTYIGYGNETSASYFLEKLSELATAVLKNGANLQVNLVDVVQNFQNVSWTQGAEVLQSLTQQQIQKACQAQICNGAPLNTTAATPIPHNAAIRKREAPMMTSAASRPTSPLLRLVNYGKALFSWDSWNESYDRVLESVVGYSRSIVEECPSYFPGRLDAAKAAFEGSNRKFYNYPVPHIKEIGQDDPLYGQGSNYTQTAMPSSSFSFLPRYQPLALSR